MLTISEAASRYSVARSTVERHIKSGKLKTVPGSSPLRVTEESCLACFGAPRDSDKVLELERRLNDLLRIYATVMKPKILALEEECGNLRNEVKELAERLQHKIDDNTAYMNGDIP